MMISFISRKSDEKSAESLTKLRWERRWEKEEGRERLRRCDVRLGRVSSTKSLCSSLPSFPRRPVALLSRQGFVISWIAWVHHITCERLLPVQSLLGHCSHLHWRQSHCSHCSSWEEESRKREWATDTVIYCVTVCSSCESVNRKWRRLCQWQQQTPSLKDVQHDWQTTDKQQVPKCTLAASGAQGWGFLLL